MFGCSSVSPFSFAPEVDDDKFWQMPAAGGVGNGVGIGQPWVSSSICWRGARKTLLVERWCWEMQNHVSLSVLVPHR